MALRTPRLSYTLRPFRGANINLLEKCPETLHILDRFHIVAKMNNALDEVRADESRRMAHEGMAPVLKKSRWLLLKREEHLKTEQPFRLRDLLRYNLKTVRAYLLKESLSATLGL